MLEIGLYEYLQGVTAVTNLVGTDVYFVRVPKGGSFPALVIHTIDSPPLAYTSDGTSNLEDRRIQIDCISSVDQLDARSIAKVVKAALLDYTGTLPDGTVVHCTEYNGSSDLPYELGAKSYAFGTMLDFSLVIDEATS